MLTNAQLGLRAVNHYDNQLRLFSGAARTAAEIGNQEDFAAALQHQAYVHEKKLEFADAEALLQQALTVYSELGDLSGMARCYHTKALWAFHSGLAADSITLFNKASELRSSRGDWLSCAQSWHNVGYVHCRLDDPHNAFRSYALAADNVDKACAAGQARVVALGSDHRDMAFILSHLAFAHAKFNSRAQAIAAAARYFEHVARTGIHREPYLAYLAVAVALTRDEKDDASDIEHDSLRRLTGLPPEPTEYFSHIERNRNERVYLGTTIAAQMEFGKYLAQSGQVRQGRRRLRLAIELGTARGWKSEASRAKAFAQSLGVKRNNR